MAEGNWKGEGLCDKLRQLQDKTRTQDHQKCIRSIKAVQSLSGMPATRLEKAREVHLHPRSYTCCGIESRDKETSSVLQCVSNIVPSPYCEGFDAQEASGSWRHKRELNPFSGLPPG